MKSTWKWGLSALGVALLSACASHSDIHSAQTRLDAKAWGLEEGALAEATAQPSWWLPLGDPQLNALMDLALSGHPSLQVVAARAARAQAQLAMQQGVDAPQLQAQATAARRRYTANGLYPDPIAGNIYNDGTLQLEGSWELDLFGKQRAVIESALGQDKAAEADVQSARVVLSTQVARAYVQLGRLLAQKAVLQRTLAQREEMLSLVAQRVKGGLDTKVELRQGEGALPEVRQQIEAMDEQIAWSRHALAALTAQPPSATAALTPQLNTLQALALPHNLPVDLLGTRADIVAARWRAEASGHAVEAARAEFYPNIDLTAYAGFNALMLDQVLYGSSRQWGILPAIHLPILDGDRRRANLRGTVADQDVAVANYNQTVMDAVKDVVDQLSSLASIARQQREQAQAQTSAESAYDLAVQRYRAGLGSYLVVLSAESAVLNQRRLQVDLQARTLDAQLALVRALGGQLGQPTGSTPHASLTHQNLNSQSGDRS
ncbi:efflux transporter outer membrane subunit [Aquabacterium sp.]|uniref:efflux transporter outer membrane subunit n=1 Tax=Aquabacterium sp. TaxID=1872578 RepID=UPI0035B03E22